MCEPITTYTREQAIKDGVLIDISVQAKEAGIKFPTAITSAVMSMVEDKPEHEDVDGRTWDVVWMLRCAINAAKGSADIVTYPLIMNTPENGHNEIKLKAVVAGGDSGEPVITIMKIDED